MRYLPALAVLAPLAACTATSDMTSDAGTTMAADASASASAMPADAMPTDASAYVMMAGASDLYEIQSSQLALQKSSNDAIRGFAQMMIDDHTKTTQTVTAAARAAGMTPPPPALQPMQAQMIAELQPLSGADFDATYVSQQRTAHDMALALHSNYAQNGDTAELRQAASTAVPIIQHHIQQLQAMPAS
jgi:putative membrane protein